MSTTVIRYVFVPGLGGTRIYCGGSCERALGRLFPSYFGSMHKHFFDGSCTDVQLRTFSHFARFLSVYQNLLKRLGDECIIFNYDWRLDALTCAKQLQTFMDENKVSEECTLIGHSNGGLIIRILLEYLRRPHNGRVFICGTPIYGSQNYKDYNVELSLFDRLAHRRVPGQRRRRSVVFTQHDMDRIMTTFTRSLVMLVPSYIFERYTIDELAAMFNHRCVDVAHLTTVAIIHRTLAHFSGQRYVFFYNVRDKHRSSRRQCTHREFIHGLFDGKNNTDAAPSTNTLDIHRLRVEATEEKCTDRTGCIVYSDKQIVSDGLVLPAQYIPRNACVMIANDYLPHCLQMNSSFLLDILKHN